MSRFDRPLYADLTLNDDPTASADVVELKLDGMWGHLIVGEGRWTIYSRHGREKATGEAPAGLAFELQGEYLKRSRWANDRGLGGQFWAFDIQAQGRPLYERRELLERVIAKHRDSLAGLPPLEIVPQYPASEWERVWSEKVVGEGYEGLVFKRSSAPYGEGWARLKQTHSIDYVCLGCNAGAGQFAGNAAGSLRAGLFIDGELRQVCNVAGLSVALRRAIWADPDAYIGRVFEAEGKAVYNGTTLRHPNFLRWRDDKAPGECRSLISANY